MIGCFQYKGAEALILNVSLTPALRPGLLKYKKYRALAQNTY